MKKKTINLIEENVYDLSIHDSPKTYNFTHVYFGKNKVYFLKLDSSTKKGNLKFTIVSTKGKESSRPRKNLGLWSHNPNLYTLKDWQDSIEETFNFKRLRLLKRKIKNSHYIPEIDKNFHFPDWAESMINDILADTNIMLSGEPGTGKSTIIQQLGARLNIPVYRIQCSGGSTVESFIGGFVPSESGGARWEDGFVTRACREGAWVILDEYDAINSNVRLSLQGILESKSRILSLSDKNEILTRKNGGINSGFRIFATGNTLGSMSDKADLFGGTTDSNMASMTRWNVYIVDYLTDSELYKVLRNNVPQINRKLVKDIVNLAREVNKAKIPGVSFNTRTALAIANKLKYKVTLEQALQPVLLNLLGSNEANKVKKIISTTGIALK